MKKTLILALILLSLLPVYPKTAEITINNSIDFNSLIDKRAEGWFYHVKESYPVIPSQKFRIEEEGRVKITNVVLNAKEWSEISGATIVSGENSLPYEFNAGERSVVRDVKGQFPFEPYRVSVGYKDGKSVIYGYVSGYYYDNGRIYSRAGSLTIEYLVENPLKPMTESKSILVIAPDSLKSS